MRRQVAHYRILEKLGEGGMGEVYRAEDTRLEREVALKILRPEVFAHEDRLLHLRQEAVSLARINHRNIITLYSIEEADGVQFLTMELVDGEPLSRLIPRRGFPLERFFALAIPVADALAAAHQRGVVHRDLKPGNILVGHEGEVKVLDFGLAGRREVIAGATGSEATTALLNASPHPVGTLPYISPEQAEGKPADERSDIFSLGVVLYEMATGHRPFEGDTPAVLLSSILRDVPGPVTEERPELPEPLARIIRLCLEKDPRRRLQSAGDVRNELQALRDELGPRTREQVARPWWRHRRPVLRHLAVVVAAVAVTLLLLLLVTRQGTRGPSPAGLVAVLPFSNLTGDPSQDYLCEGMSAALTQKLSEMRELRLLGQSEVMAQARESPSSRRLARELGVSMVVEGHLSQAPDPVEVSVMLIAAEPGIVAWSRTFERSRAELPALQREIAQQLAEALALPLSPSELDRLGRTPTASYEAYDLYLRGQQILERVGEAESGTRSGAAEGPEAAAELFRQAMRFDPRFALAHVGLSEALWVLSHQAGKRSLLEEAEREARRALELDRELPAAELALARIHSSDGRYASAIESLEGVLADHPRPARAQRELARNYEQVGDLDKARGAYQTAAALGNDDWFNWNALGAFLIRTGDYSGAERALRRAVELTPPEVVPPRQNLVGLAILRGDFDGAISRYEEMRVPIHSAGLASNLATAYYFSDRPNGVVKAEELYRLAVELEPGNAVVHGNLADVLAQRPAAREEAMRHYRRALELVEQQLAERPDSPVASFAEWRPLLLQRALYAAKAGECSTATPLATDLRRKIPDNARDLHDLGIVFAVCDEDESAVEVLAEAVRLGFSPELIAREGEFSGLHARGDFQRLLAGGGP